MITPDTGHSENKDGRGLEQERVKRSQEAQKTKKKRDLVTRLAAIKNFIFSTKTMIDAKQPVLKNKEIKEREIKVEISAIETKEHSVEAQLQRAKEAVEKVQLELDKLKQTAERKKKDLVVVEHEDAELKRQIAQLTADKAKLDMDLRKVEAEIIRAQ